MTIDTNWCKLFKRTNARAFNKKIPISPDAVFIDGQIRLQKSQYVTTWADLIAFNFVRPIEKWFNTGATTVILAFDCYDHVPACKSMTQTKRRKHLPDVTVSMHESLPPHIPFNYDQLILNRAWKTKVINLIIDAVPALVKQNEGQTLIIDWVGEAIRYTANADPTRDTNLMSLGENDVKATRYLRYGNLLMDTTDGDFIPIALIQLERIIEAKAKANEAVHVLENVPQLAIYRMECNINGTRGAPKDDNAHQRKYEFVHINRLYIDIRNMIQIATSNGRRTGSETAHHEMRILSLLIALTGTDFSKGMPYVSPQRVWDNLPIIWGNMQNCYDPSTSKLDILAATNTVVARLYAEVYKNHITNNRIPMNEVADRLKRHSELSETVKSRLPEFCNMVCLIKNCNWIVQYWMCPEDGAYPDPVSGEYGYKRNRKGAVMYEDDA